MKEYYFLATPLYSFHGNKLVWDPNLQAEWIKIIDVLKKSDIKVVVAFRDLDQNKSGEQLCKKEFQLIKNSLGIIVILGNTPGIYMEAGYARGISKKLYGIRTANFKRLPPKVQQWLESTFNAVFDSPEELIKNLP